MSKIAITENEFFLILAHESHPRYQASEPEHVENYKAYNEIIRVDVTDLETKEVYSLEAMRHHELGYVLADIQGCDFYIDSDKEELYTSDGKLLSDIPPEPVPEKTRHDIYDEMKANNELTIPEKMEDVYSLVSLEELKKLITTMIPFIGNKKKVEGHSFMDLANTYFSISFENKIEADYMRSVIQKDMEEFKKSKKVLTLSRFIKHYTAMHNLESNGFIEVEIGGKMVKINKKELDNIQKI